MWIILAIVLSIIFMVICACLWREDKKDDYYELDCGCWVMATFIGCPTFGLIMATFVDIVLTVFGLWLIPIALIICLILVFVYWDELIKWLKDMKEGDEQCG